MATVTKEILEDRLDGAMNDPAGGFTSEGLALYQAIEDVAELVARRPMDDRVKIGKREMGVDVVLDLDGLLRSVGSWILERAEKVPA